MHSMNIVATYGLLLYALVIVLFSGRCTLVVLGKAEFMS